MMVYEGPGAVSRIRKELAQLMAENGQRRIEDVVGIDHDDLYWKKREERLLSRRHEEKIFE
jgi:dihydroorotate dehydrogenase